jgi:hypothetical protein
MKELTVEFLLILSEDTDLVATDDDRTKLVQGTGEFAMRLVGEGRLKGGGQLRPASEGRTIRRRGGDTRVLEGPFAEAKEVIAGWMLLDAASLDEAVGIASECPNADVGSVLVRQCVPQG